SSKLDNADAFSITNDELHQESLQKKISAGIGIAFDLVDVVPFGKLAKGLRALGRLVNPRKILARLPKGIHLLRETGHANKVPFGVARHNTGVGGAGPSLELLKEIEIPSNRLKDLKYIKADNMYADGPYRYIRIGKRVFRLDQQRDVLTHEIQFFIRKEFDSATRYPVERVGDQWVVKKEPRTAGGNGRETSSTPTVTVLQQPMPTLRLRLRHPDRVLLDNLAQSLSRTPFNEQALQRNFSGLVDALGAEPNRAAFRRTLEMHVADGVLSRRQMDTILAQTNPYDQVQTFLNYLLTKDSGVIAGFPTRLGSAIDNGEAARKAAVFIANQNKQAAADLTSLQGRLANGTFDMNALRRNNPELVDALGAEPNRAAFRRTLNIHFADGVLTREEIDTILAQTNPYDQVQTFLNYLLVKDSRVIAGFPTRLGSAIDNDEAARKAAVFIANQNKQAAADLTSLQGRLANGTFDMNALRRNNPELVDALGAEPNRAAFRRTLEMHVADGVLSRRQMDTILAQANPYDQVQTFLNYLLTKDSGVIAGFPTRLGSAIDNGEAARKAAVFIANQNKQAAADLTSLQGRLANGAFDMNALRRNNPELVDALGAEPNRAAFRRTLNIHFADGVLTREEMDTILAQINPYDQVQTFLNYLLVKDSGVIAGFPSRLGNAMTSHSP
ncbi:hypothetical protein, partial [Burkholderia pyrrocinia]|uniref:hypothetical protein n=1 Tax=Burkholderia pyrrocinia TaxID=60550 RepID=UPI00158DD8D9